jgi:tetratricopeptide (TPR) repeat protein
VIDRDNEVRTILRFLDDRSATVLQVVGLPQIGKTAVIDKALAQSGLRAPLRVAFSASASVDYLLYALLGPSAPLGLRPPYAEPSEVARTSNIREALQRAQLVIIERADHIFNHDNWNDERWPSILAALVDSAKAVDAQIIIETRRELPFDVSTQTEVQRLRIAGLDRTLVEIGIELFDSQLRRVGLSPSVFGYDDKRTVISKLGGHPLGIALAADVAYVDGIAAVVDALRNRKGFFITFIGDLIRDLSLSDHETTLLKICGLARSGIPREALLAAADFPAAAAIRNLLRMAALDYTDDGLVTIASLLREHFDQAELSPATRAKFHRSAATHLATAAKNGPLSFAIEAEYHARLAGIQRQATTGLSDSALAAAETLYAQQDYDAALAAIQHFLDVAPTTEILRRAALIEARRNHFEAALRYAEQAFARNRRDTFLLAELAKIALTEFQHFGVADRLVAIARKAGVEDVSILIVEGRLHLRRGQLVEAAQTFLRACELTERNPWPYFYLGTTNIRLGDLDAAVDALHAGEEFFYSKEARSKSALAAIQTQLAVAYIFMDRVDLAEPIVNSLMKRNPENPEVIRAFAALTIKKDGITEAHRALEELKKAKIRNDADRCQFHLIYGLFYLGIGDLPRASEEFSKASNADRSNVYVMIKWARTLYEIGQARWLDADDSHPMYLADCARLVRKILDYDVNNPDATNLAVALHTRFEIDV